MKVYVIGSLRNPRVPEVAEKLRSHGFEVFDDWYAAGPDADDTWRDYEKARGHDFISALEGEAAGHVFNFDLLHLRDCDAAVLVLPAGKSGHLELGYVLGMGKAGYILLDEDPNRFDVMYKFADRVTTNLGDIAEDLKHLWASMD